jgi:uncharacterized protein YqeY
MGDLRKQLGEDLKEAMKAKDRVRMETVRNIRGAIANREVEKGEELDEAGILGVIKSLAKQRVESIAGFEEGGRDDLVEKEKREKEILESYLPAAPDEARVGKVTDEVIVELGATSMKQMGGVMKECMARLGPAADGKMVSSAVKAKLGK